MSSEAQEIIQKIKSAFYWSVGSFILGWVALVVVTSDIRPPITKFQENVIVGIGVFSIVAPSIGLLIILRILKNALMNKVRKSINSTNSQH